MLVSKGMGNAFTDAIASQVGGLQDPCTAGGMFCPQPQSTGASFNPCCWSSAASTYATVDPNTGVAVTDNPLGVPDFVTAIPGWAWAIVGIGAGIWFLRNVR